MKLKENVLIDFIFKVELEFNTTDRKEMVFICKKTRFISYLGEPENFESGGPIFRIGFPLKASGGLTSTDFKNRTRLNNGKMFDPLTVKK